MNFIAWALSPVARLIPNLGPISTVERLRASVGALVGLVVTGFVSRAALGSTEGLPLLIAPMGASAVLLFAVPSSPLAQPWSILGGNVVAALIGVTFGRLIGDPILAAALACGCAIGAMLVLRCLHPPSGAVALTAVLGGPVIHKAGYVFAVWPVGLNSVLLLGVALAFNNLTGHRYPHLAKRQPPDHPVEGTRGVSRTDLDRALDRHGELLDVDRDDLADLLQETEIKASRIRLGATACGAIMRPATPAVVATDGIEVALAALPVGGPEVVAVVDARGKLVGTLTQADVYKHLRRSRIGRRAAHLFRRSIRFDLAPRTVGDIVGPPPLLVAPEDAVASVAPRLVNGGFAWVAVIDTDGHPLGFIGQSDLLRVLYRGLAFRNGGPDL